MQYVEVETKWEQIGFAVMVVRHGYTLPVTLGLFLVALRTMQLGKAGLMIALAVQKQLSVKKSHDSGP